MKHEVHMWLLVSLKQLHYVRGNSISTDFVKSNVWALHDSLSKGFYDVDFMVEGVKADIWHPSDVQESNITWL